MMKVLMFISVLMLAASCGKPLPANEDREMGYLSFIPRFSHAVEVETKGAFGTIDGVNFQFDGSIFVYNAGTTVPHVLGYDNMRTQVDAKWEPNTSMFGFSWLFFPSGITTDGLDAIGIMKGTPVDVYAYVPYTENMGDVTSIPFKTADQNDIMLASKENITVTGMSNQLLYFKHAMSCITMRVKTMFSTNIYISNIYIRNTNSAGRYVAQSGTINARTGEVNDLKYDNSWINVAINPHRLLNKYTSALGPTEFSILIPPVEDYSDEMGIEIYLRSRQGVDTEHFYLPLPPESTDGKRPFENGKEYIYDVTHDDFIMVSPAITVVGYDTVPDHTELEF